MAIQNSHCQSSGASGTVGGSAPVPQISEAECLVSKELQSGAKAVAGKECM